MKLVSCSALGTVDESITPGSVWTARAHPSARKAPGRRRHAQATGQRLVNGARHVREAVERSRTPKIKYVPQSPATESCNT